MWTQLVTIKLPELLAASVIYGAKKTKNQKKREKRKKFILHIFALLYASLGK